MYFVFQRRLFALLACFSCVTAHAHFPYLAPASFEPVRNWVSLEAAFAEKFFLPEAKFDLATFVVTTPDGSERAPTELQTTRSRTLIDDELKSDGTYRYSTGQRFGAVFHSYELNGKTENSRDANFVLPEGAVLKAHFQSVTQADTFVSKGKLNTTALKARSTGLEIEFTSHPNDLYVGQPIKARLLSDGRSLPASTVQLHRTGIDHQAVAPLSVKTNATGEFEVTPSQAGVYVLVAKHRANSPAGAKAPIYSYTSTTVLEVVE
jgi:uncharacterized GH25 family protein